METPSTLCNRYDSVKYLDTVNGGSDEESDNSSSN